MVTKNVSKSPEMGGKAYKPQSGETGEAHMSTKSVTKSVPETGAESKKVVIQICGKTVEVSEEMIKKAEQIATKILSEAPDGDQWYSVDVLVADGSKIGYTPQLNTALHLRIAVNKGRQAVMYTLNTPYLGRGEKSPNMLRLPSIDHLCLLYEICHELFDAKITERFIRAYILLQKIREKLGGVTAPRRRPTVETIEL